MIVEPLGENVQDLQSCIIESLEARKAQRQTISDLQSTVNKLEGDSLELAALKVEHSIAMAALDKSQAHNARIKDGTELANYEAFTESFELWWFGDFLQVREAIYLRNSGMSEAYLLACSEAIGKYNQLKAQHIGSDEVTEVE